MNIAFWIIIILALAAVWFLCNPVFKYIGGFAKDAADNVKRNTSDDTDGEPHEGKEEYDIEQR